MGLVGARWVVHCVDAAVVFGVGGLEELVMKALPRPPFAPVIKALPLAIAPVFLPYKNA